MAKRRPTKSQATVQYIPKDKREEVNDGFIIVQSLIESLAKKDSRSDLTQRLDHIKAELLSEDNKKKLRQLQRDIASALRSMPSLVRPKFERVKFYIWVLDNIAGAKETLPLLDDLGWCPDSYMSYIKEHMNDANFGYKTYDNGN